MGSDSDTERVVDRLLERYGTPFSEDLGLDLGRNTPSVLFRWLCAALLMSARISHEAALQAARALSDAGWTTAKHMADSTWDERVKVLNRSGYARYDESTARMLGDTVALLLDEYDGDLRKLREAAGRDPDAQRERLKAFKGIGDVGADIFFRELQTVWSEHFPFLDDKARDAARRMGLPDAAGDLAERVGRKRFPALAVALARAEVTGVTREALLEGQGEAAS